MLDDDGPKKILDDVAEAKIVALRNGEKRGVSLLYKSGRKGTIEINNRSNTIDRISVSFGAKELEELQTGKLVPTEAAVDWLLQEATTNPTVVDEHLEETFARLAERNKDYQELAAFAGPGEPNIVPTPRTGKGLLGALDRWLRSLLNQ